MVEKTELNSLFSIEHNNFYVSRDAHQIVLRVLSAAAGAAMARGIERIDDGLAECVCVVDISLVECRVQLFFFFVFFLPLFFNYCNGSAGPDNNCMCLWLQQPFIFFIFVLHIGK